MQKCKELKSMTVKLKCDHEIDTNFADLEAGFDKLAMEMHKEEQEIIDTLKNPNIFEVDFEPILERYNDNLNRKESENSRRVNRVILKFFDDKQKKYKRRLDSYRLEEGDEFDGVQFSKFLENLIEINFILHKMKMFKGIKVRKDRITLDTVEKEVEGVISLMTRYFNDIMLCISNITNANQDYNFCLERFGEAEQCFYECTHKFRNYEHNDIVKKFQAEMRNMETKVISSLAPLGYKEKIAMGNQMHKIKNLFVSLYELSIRKLDEIYGEKKDFSFDEGFKQFYNYLGQKEPIKKKEVDEKVEERLNKRLDSFKNNYDKEYSKREQAERELRKDLRDLEELDIPIFQEFKKQLGKLETELEDKVNKDVETAIEKVEKQISFLPDCLSEIRKAQDNKQEAIADKYKQKLKLLYDGKTSQEALIGERIDYVAQWIEEPLLKETKRLEEVGLKEEYVGLFNSNVKLLEAEVKTRFANITKVFSANLDDFNFSEKVVIDQTRETFEVLDYCFKLKNHGNLNLPAVEELLSSSQEKMEQLFKVISSRISVIRETPSLLTE